MLNVLTNLAVPKNLAALSTAEILHGDVCDKDEMPNRGRFKSGGTTVATYRYRNSNVVAAN